MCMPIFVAPFASNLGPASQLYDYFCTGVGTLTLTPWIPVQHGQPILTAMFAENTFAMVSYYATHTPCSAPRPECHAVQAGFGEAPGMDHTQPASRGGYWVGTAPVRTHESIASTAARRETFEFQKRNSCFGEQPRVHRETE